MNLLLNKLLEENPEYKLIQWSGKTSSYHHKWHDTPNPENDNEPALTKVWVLNAQWTNCPIEVEDEVRKIWVNSDLGNDTSIYKTTLQELIYDYPIIAQYIIEQNLDIQEKDLLFIHWWW